MIWIEKRGEDRVLCGDAVDIWNLDCMLEQLIALEEGWA